MWTAVAAIISALVALLGMYFKDRGTKRDNAELARQLLVVKKLNTALRQKERKERAEEIKDAKDDNASELAAKLRSATGAGNPAPQ